MFENIGINLVESFSIEDKIIKAMKTVYFIRHAKSSWDNVKLADIERPLNNRGLKDAPFMADFLKEKENPSFDGIFTSPAVRAASTALLFSKVFMVEPQVVPSIYEAEEDTILEILQELDDNLYQTVAIFGHNPTFTYLANLFSEDYISNVPTCGIFKVIGRVSKWSDFKPGNARVEATYFPKELE